MVSSATPNYAKSVKYAPIQKISTVKRFAWVNSSSHNGQDGVSTRSLFFGFLAYIKEKMEKKVEKTKKKPYKFVVVYGIYTRKNP